MPFFTRDELYTTNNRRQLRMWFIEYSKITGTEPKLNLSYYDGYEGTKSLKDIYMQYCVEDPTESKFAEYMFGDVAFWLEIRDEPWLQEPLRIYRKEADTRRKAMAFESVVDEIKTKSRSAFSAAKFLIDEPWLVGSSVSEKKAIAKRKQESTEEALEASKAVEDFKRLMGNTK